MKKIFSCVLALFAAVSMFATDLNIYASGLKAKMVNDSVCSVEYVLNAPATSVDLLLYLGDITQASVKTLTDAADLTKGPHTVQVTLPANTPAGAYDCAIRATGAARAADETLASTISLTGSRGMAIDDDPKSPFYGTIYVAENLNGGVGGHILAVSPDLSSVDTLASGWGSGASSPMRITVGEDHLLYITDWSDAAPNLFIVDPATPGAAPTPVFGGAYTLPSGAAFTADSVAIHGSIAGCRVLGTGSKRVLYTVDEDVKPAGKLNILTYNIGRLDQPWEAAPSGSAYVNADGKLANANVNFYPDGKGGWWISQHRWGDGAANPALMHAAAGADTLDWHSKGEATIATGKHYNNRASLYVAPDKQTILTSADSLIIVWKAYYTGNAVDSVVKVKTIFNSIPSIFNVVLDPAGNIYAVNATGGAITAFVPATENNSCTTIAPKKLYVGVEPPVEHLYFMGGDFGWDPTKGIEMDNVADNVFEGTFTFSNDTNYLAFFDALAENNDDGGWAYVNAHRYAGKDNNFLLNHTAWTDSIRKNENTLRLAPAGVYKLKVDLNKQTVYVARKASLVPEGALYVAFKDVEGKVGGDDGKAVTALNDLVSAGAELFDSVLVANKLYQSREGCGIKFGTTSAAGELKLRLAQPVTPEKIIINAVAYGNSEGTAVLMGDTVELTANGNKVVAPYVKEYDGQTAITELTFSHVVKKRFYLLDVIIIPSSQEPPTPLVVDSLFEIGDNQGWKPAEGIAMTKTAENVFEGEFTFTADTSYFAFATVKTADWEVVNANRYASATTELVGDNAEADLAVGEYTFRVAPSGVYKMTVNFNTMKLAVVRTGDVVPPVVVVDSLFEIGDNQGWTPAEGIAMTKTAENVFEGQFTFTVATSYFAFTSVKTADWDVVNANRFGGNPNNQLIAVGSEFNMATGAQLCFTATPGTYKLIVDLNNMKLSVLEGTGINNMEGEQKVIKVIENGQLFIIRDGIRYTATGARVE